MPSEVKKNPWAHLAQAVPLSALVHPALQEHCPFEPHTPFRQLHDEGGFKTGAERHRPVPEIPSSQDVQPWGHGWQFGPKNPWAHDSHEDPVKPVGQVHVPDAEQIPAPEHGGEHAED